RGRATAVVPAAVDPLVHGGQIVTHDLGDVDLIRAGVRPVTGRSVVGAVDVGLLAVESEQPFGRPGALPARLPGAELDGSVGEREGAHLDGGGCVGFA